MPYDPLRHGPQRLVGPGFHARVFALVETVPAGFVTTYGDVARGLGSVNVARHVGYAMAALPTGTTVPWWRVIAANGRIANVGSTATRQRQLLAQEGVAVKKGRVTDFARHRFVFAD